MKRALLIAALALVAVAPAGADPVPPGAFTTSNDGAALYGANCSMCHGSRGEGMPPPPNHRGSGDISGAGPSLRGVGALAADFYLRTGYMPLRSASIQPTRSRVLFSETQIRALVAYVDSFGGGPAIPTPHPERGSLSDGRRLFTSNCAGCHQIVAEGGFATGARVPPLEDATPTQIAEAIRVGPYVMPHFSERHLSDEQVDSIIRYVQYAKAPDDRGGWSLGHIGPVPEGLVTWWIGAVILVAFCILLGRRLRRA